MEKELEKIQIASKLAWKSKNQKFVSSLETSSMLPILKGEDLLEIETYKNISIDNFSVGDLIVFAEGEKVAVHRLIKIDKKRNTFLIKGDNNSSTDDVSIKQIIGEIISAKRKSTDLKILKSKFANYTIAHLSLLELKVENACNNYIDLLPIFMIYRKAFYGIRKLLSIIYK